MGADPALAGRHRVRRRGVVVVFAALFTNFLMAAMTRCTGVMYLSWQNEFGSSSSQTGAIGSTMSSTSYFASAIAAVICNRYGCRFTWICGGIISFVSLLSCFWVTSLYQMYIIGASMGTGVALTFLALNVATAEYFKKYYALAAGIVSSGIAIGIMASPPLLNLLLVAYGWRGTMLITAGFSANVCVAGMLYRPLNINRSAGEAAARPSPDETSDNFDYKMTDLTDENGADNDEGGHGRVIEDKKSRPCSKIASFLRGICVKLRLDLFVKSYRFALFCLVTAQFNMAYGCLLIYLIPGAVVAGIDESRAPLFLSLFGFGSLVGRLLSGALYRVPVEVVYAISIAVTMAGSLCVQFGSFEAYLAAASLAGCGTGANKAMSSVLQRKITGMANFASGLGISYVIGGVGDLAGPIIAGRLYDITGSYSTMFYVISGLLCFILLQMFLMPLLRILEPGLEDNDAE